MNEIDEPRRWHSVTSRQATTDLFFCAMLRTVVLVALLLAVATAELGIDVSTGVTQSEFECLQKSVRPSRDHPRDHLSSLSVAGL